MITCHSVQRIQGLDFNSYLLLPQYSHSYVKNESNGFIMSKNATAKMRLGSLVDGILTNGEVDMGDPLYNAAKPIAYYLDDNFGWCLNRLQKQVSLTGIIRYDAGKAIFEMPIKGRPDYTEPKHLILDLKVTGEHIDKIDSLIGFMGYPNQTFLYAKLDQCIDAYLLIYSTKSKQFKVKQVAVGDTNRFWEEKIIKFGKAI